MVAGGGCTRSPLLTGTRGALVLGVVERGLGAYGIWEEWRGGPECAGSCAQTSPVELRDVTSPGIGLE